MCEVSQISHQSLCNEGHTEMFTKCSRNTNKTYRHTIRVKHFVFLSTCLKSLFKYDDYDVICIIHDMWHMSYVTYVILRVQCGHLNCIHRCTRRSTTHTSLHFAYLSMVKITRLYDEVVNRLQNKASDNQNTQRNWPQSPLIFSRSKGQ